VGNILYTILVKLIGSSGWTGAAQVKGERLKGEKAERQRPIRILHVDDEENQLEFTKLFLEEIDKEVVIDSVSDPDEAVRLASKNSYDCIVSDYKMLSMSGIELAQRVREMSRVPFILYTGQGSEDVAQLAFEAGVDDYLKKEPEPSNYQVLAKRVRQNVEKYRAEQLYHKVVDESRDGIMILTGSTVAFANEAATRALCGDEGSLVGRSILDCIIGSEKELLAKLEATEMKREGAAPFFEVQFRTGAGAIRVAEVSSSRISYLGRDAHLCFFRDVTRRKRMEERLEVLHLQAVRLGGLTGLKAVASAALDVMAGVFEYQTLSFQVAEGDHLKTLDVRGAPLLGLSLPMDGPGITVKAAREKHSILVNDVRGCKDYFKGSANSMSELAVPVVLEGETVAVLNVESLELNDFTEDDRRLLEALSPHVAYALSRAKHRGPGDAESEKAMRLNYALGRLDDAEKVDAMILGELQSSLRSIRDASDILREQPEMLPDLAASIDVSADHASRVADMIRETVSASMMNGSFSEVNASVRAVLEAGFLPRSIKVRAVYSEAPLVTEVPRERMTRVMENLVRNAVEAMPDGGTLEVKVATRQNQARIEVKDSGPGIPPQAMDRLFQPFNTTKQGHSGLGLAFAKKAVEAAGGSIEAKTSDKGTVIVVAVPARNLEKD
jgi:PAS domain S-box-containing protein